MAVVTVVDTGNAALHAVAERIAMQKDELARRTLDRWHDEIVGWQIPDEADLARGREFVVRNIDELVSELERDATLPEEFLAVAREVGARRVHQGLSLEAMLQQGRLWAEVVWEFVLEAARLDRPEEREAALQIAGRLWRHVDQVSGSLAYGYLDELTDRGLLGRDLLDALLAGRGDSERVRRLARMLHKRLGENHVVVLIRAEAVTVESGGPHPPAARDALDQIVEAARTHLRPAEASLLVGIRQGDVVAIYPAAGPRELEVVRRHSAALARHVAIDVSIGMSGWHTGRPAIAAGYAEAVEAVEIAAGTGIRGRAVALDDVLVDHMLRASAHAQRILEATLAPLVAYDAARHADLIQTLRAYLGADTNLTRTARTLMVHPNTVVYRLRRIRELSGRDPHNMEDLQILFLALKLSELTTAEPGA